MWKCFEKVSGENFEHDGVVCGLEHRGRHGSFRAASFQLQARATRESNDEVGP